MRPLHSRKGARRYRYYVSPRLVEGSVETGASGWRFPAAEVEEVLGKAIAKRLADPELRGILLGTFSRPEEADRLASNFQDLCNDLSDTRSRRGRERLMSIVQRVDLSQDQLAAAVSLRTDLAYQHGHQVPDYPDFEIAAPIEIASRGAELKLILKGAAGEDRLPEPNLVRCVLDARRWFKAYADGDRPMTLSQIAAAEGTDAPDVSRSMQLAFLAPDLVGAVLDGRQPAHLNATRLQRLENLPLLWEDQRAILA